MNITFLGTGLMGLPMALNIVKAGFALTAWNRTHHKTAPLGEQGAYTPPLLADALQDADIIISMLENISAQESVLFNTETLTLCKAGALIIDMGSIAPQSARRHAAQANALNLNYLDAPVSGGTLGAELGSLVIMAGGAINDLERARSVLSTMADKIVHIGTVGCGQIAKCANQAIVGITIGAISEALVLAHKGGADPVAVRQALLGGFASSKILEQHGERMLSRNFTPGGTARVQLKDLNTISDFAQQQNCKLPLTELARTQYQQLVNTGDPQLDHSSLILLLEQLNNTTLVSLDQTKEGH